MKRSKKSNRAIIVLIVLLIALAVGYAIFQTVLTINGTATGSFTWDVHFTDATKFYEVTDAGGKGAAITDANRATTDIATAQVTTDASDAQQKSQTLTATVTLNYPGDAVILEAVILNNGTQPARLTGFTVPGTQNGLIVSNPTITSGADGEILNPGKTCTVQFLVKWDPSVAAIGENGSGTQTFDIEFTYSQETTTKSYTTEHIHPNT